MEITKQQSAGVLNLVVNGRLDAYWADHLAKELGEVLRGGVHRVSAVLAAVLRAIRALASGSLSQQMLLRRKTI